MKEKKNEVSEQIFWNTEARVYRSLLVRANIKKNLEETIKTDMWLNEAIGLLGDTQGRKILDCGCGMGSLGVYLTMRGAYIEGFDISWEMVKVARVNAEKNGVNAKCSFLCCSFENLPYREGSFDLAVGAYVLHHVDVERAMRELHRSLTPGGKAIFIETWGKNPLLVWAGKYLAGRFGIAKYGTKYEHPITAADIKEMRKVFSEVYLEFPEFIFFKKAATNIFRWKKNLKFITDILVRMDNFVTQWFPSFNKYGYYCIIKLTKGDDKKRTVQYR